MIADLPSFIEPMLAISGQPFDSDRHLFEPKWDGVRCILRYSETIRLFSRNGRDITMHFPELTGMQPLEAPASILDGELICLNEAGKPAFDIVRSRIVLRNEGRINRASTEHPAIFIAFDLLYSGGSPLLGQPLKARRALLEEQLITQRHLHLSPAFSGSGQALFAAIGEQKLEGIMAKDLFSPYLPGQRSPAWVKVRRTEVGTFWIVGYSVRNEQLRSLALAERDNDDLVYVGHVGSGLDERTRQELSAFLKDMRLYEQPALAITPGSTAPSVWVQPHLQCRVEYLERTSAGGLRHPVFRGLVQHRVDSWTGNSADE